MTNIKITIKATTLHDPKDFKSFLMKVIEEGTCYGDINISDFDIEVIEDEHSILEKMVAEQKECIAQHGGDRAGYIKFYRGYKYFNGSNIYDGDMAELHRLERLLDKCRKRDLNRARGCRM